MGTTHYTFGGRLRPKTEHPTSWESLVDLLNERMAFIYQRLSSHEQVKKPIYSIKAQDALVDLAKEDGYPDHLIYVGKRDLGISGTKGREDRPELAYLIDRVEAGAVESVYVVHISRLYRDQTLINALALGELFKEHGIIIVTPQMRLNLRDKMHMRLYRRVCLPNCESTRPKAVSSNGQHWPPRFRSLRGPVLGGVAAVKDQV